MREARAVPEFRPNRQMRARPLRPALLAGVVFLACGGAVSCSRTPGPASSPQGARIETLPAPDTRAMNAPPPPGLDPALTVVASDADPNAKMTLEEAVDRVVDLGRGEGPPPSGIDADQPRTSSQRAEALRLYNRGRVARIEGDLPAALRDLQAAAKADPASASIWRELGEAQQASGNRAFASASFARALELDPLDARALERTSRIAVERRDYARAAALTARLLECEPERIDPALPYVAWSQLSRSLSSLGFINAAAEAAVRAADLPERWTETTSRQDELAALYRQRGDTLRDAGDAYLRLGRFEEAADAHDRAAALPTLAPAALGPRRVYARLKLGDSAGAARVVAEQLRASRGRADDVVLGLVSHVSLNTSRGREALLSELEGVYDSLDDRGRALAAGDRARVEAAAASESLAVERLRARLREAPADEDALRDLFSRMRTASPETLIERSLELVEASPLLESKYGAALSRELGARSARRAEGEASSDPWDAVTASRRDSGTGVLLRARLAALQGRLEESAAMLEPLASDPSFGPAAAVARTGLLMQLGRYDDADTLIRALDESDPMVRFAKASALSQRGDDAAALALLEPLVKPDLALPAGLQRSTVLVAAAQVCARSGSAERARDLLEAAIDADPLRDDAYVGLVSLYSRGQPLEDESRLIDAVRRMREANPSSRALRWLRAQESVNRGQLDLAERDLADLAEESPTQPEVVAALTDVWLRSGSAPKAEAWLRTKSDRYPDASILTVALAQSVTAQGRFAEAEALLTARLSRTPGDAGVSRALERLYREHLAQPDKADELAKARLANAPQTAETLLEQADMAWRSGDYSKATDILRRMVDRFPRLTFRPEQVARLGDFIASASKQALGDNAVARPFVDLVNTLMVAAPGVDAEAHRFRLLVSGRSWWIDPAEMVAYLRAASARFPQRAEAYLVETVNEMWRRDPVPQNDPRNADPAKMRALIESARARALAVIEQSPEVLGKVTPRVVIEWLNLALINRRGPSFVTAVNLAKDAGIIDAVLAAIETGGGNPRQPRQRTLADSAYQIAGFLTFLDQDAAAEEMLALGLRYDALHAPCANDLSYRLLVADRDIDRAEKLAELAVMREPNNASYLDTLGWARYKQGRVHDSADPETGKPREGAVTLLKRSLDTAMRDQINRASQLSIPIILDHLADAQWAAGDRESAEKNWILAAQDAQSALEIDDKAANSPDPDDRDSRMGQAMRREIEQVLLNSRAKVGAVQTGQPPAVAKMHAEANAPPPDAAAP